MIISRAVAWARGLGYHHVRGRDVRLDFLRGWCIFSMVVDHAAEQRSSPLFAVTGNGPWPLTGAHGFVMLSGLVVGLLYRNLLDRQGPRAAMEKLGRRVLKLYLVAVALGLFDMVWSATPLGGSAGFDAWALPRLVLLLSGSDDLMTFYFTMMVLAAPILLACHRRLWPLVLAASLGAWLLHNHDERLLNSPLTYFVPVADWQLLFVGGLLIGYHREAIGGWLKGARRTGFVALVLVLFAATVVVQSEILFDFVDTTPGWLAWIQDQGWQGYDHNPPLHMAIVFADLFALYYLVTWLWAPLSRLLGWFLIPLGQAALYVYIVHAVLVWYVLAASPYFGELQGPLLTTSLLGLMLLLWVLVKRRFLFAVIPR